MRVLIVSSSSSHLSIQLFFPFPQLSIRYPNLKREHGALQPSRVSEVVTPRHRHHHVCVHFSLHCLLFPFLALF